MYRNFIKKCQNYLFIFIFIYPNMGRLLNLFRPPAQREGMDSTSSGPFHNQNSAELTSSGPSSRSPLFSLGPSFVLVRFGLQRYTDNLSSSSFFPKSKTIYQAFTLVWNLELNQLGQKKIRIQIAKEQVQLAVLNFQPHINRIMILFKLLF